MSKRISGASEADLEQLTHLFSILSDKTRLHILFMLNAGERNVTSLCNELNLPQPTVSHHLGLLRMSNVIVHRRSGKQVFYSLTDSVSASDHTLQVGLEHFLVRVLPKPI